jgi:hypothetical protein
MMRIQKRKGSKVIKNDKLCPIITICLYSRDCRIKDVSQNCSIAKDYERKKGVNDYA